MTRFIAATAGSSGLFVLLGAPVRLHEDHPALLRRRRFRVAGPRGSALRLCRRGADHRRHRRRHRSFDRLDDGADQRHRRVDDERRQRGICLAGGALRALPGLRARRAQRHPDRRHPGARHRRHAGDAVRPAGCGAARPRGAGRRRRRLAEGADRRHDLHTGRARGDQRLDSEGARAARRLPRVVWVPLRRSRLGLSIYAIGSSRSPPSAAACRWREPGSWPMRWPGFSARWAASPLP